MPGASVSTTTASSGEAICATHSSGQYVVSRRNSVSTVTNGCAAIRLQVAASSDVVVIGFNKDVAAESNATVMAAVCCGPPCVASPLVQWLHCKVATQTRHHRAALDSPHPLQVDELPRAGHGAHRHFNDRGAVPMGEGAAQSAAQLFGFCCAYGLGSEALGESHKIGIGEIAGDQPVAVALLLGAAHVAEGAVAEHDRHQRDAVPHGGR